MSSKAICIAPLLAGALATGCVSTGDSPFKDRGNFEFEPAPAVLPRLTAKQYRNSLVDIFGEGVPAVELEKDTNPYLFTSIGATTTALSEIGAQQYADAAAEISTWVFDDEARRDSFVACTPTFAGDACIKDSIRDIGLQLFRRPLTDDEVQQWAQVAADTAEDDAYQGARLALYGMLQSPNFIYRVELGEQDPEDADVRRYTAYEMAQRLSFLLWNTSPDADLLAAAERGDLLTDEGIRDQALRLLDSDRARDSVQEFFAEYFDLGRLDQLERDPQRYPAFTSTLAESMRSEVKLLVDDHVFRRNADVRELFSTRRTWVNEDLANLYGIEAPEATAVAFVPVELPADGPRAGILTLGAFLAMNAHPTDTSPTLRGKYLRERVLCESIDPPPDDVDIDLEDPTGQAKTLREKLDKHRSDPFCASCHKYLDPPGFLFEGFDSIGTFRTKDHNGYTVDTSGDLDGIPLADARGLAEALRTDERVAACIVKQLYRHASGRLDQPGEAGVLGDLEVAFRQADYRFQDLLVELVASDGFRTVAEQEGAQ